MWDGLLDGVVAVMRVRNDRDVSSVLASADVATVGVIGLVLSCFAAGAGCTGASAIGVADT